MFVGFVVGVVGAVAVCQTIDGQVTALDKLLATSDRLERLISDMSPAQGLPPACMSPHDQGHAHLVGRSINFSSIAVWVILSYQRSCARSQFKHELWSLTLLICFCFFPFVGFNFFVGQMVCDGDWRQATLKPLLRSLRGWTRLNSMRHKRGWTRLFGKGQIWYLYFDPRWRDLSFYFVFLSIEHSENRG